MAQLFSPAFTLVARLILVGIPVVAVLAGSALAYGASWSDWATGRYQYREQPIPFSHKHHVSGLGIDCRYCHTGVEESPFAGLPPTSTCMTCHSQMWFHSPMLEPVRQSWETDTPIQWERVHDLPDYVYFDHSIHIAKGIGCSTCHGDVQEMPLTTRVVNLQMRWCIDCHQNPEKHLRPPDKIFDMTWHEPPDQLAQGGKLLALYHVQKEQLLNCSICHR